MKNKQSVYGRMPPHPPPASRWFWMAALCGIAVLSGCVEEAGAPYIMVSRNPPGAGYRVGDTITVALKNGSSYYDFEWYYSLDNPPAIHLSNTLAATGDDNDTFTIPAMFGSNSSVGGYIKIARSLTKRSDIVETEWLGPITLPAAP